ncbi:hypothetical protein [Colwellia sp. Arc7-D]|uniref:hypothetical protein n=1 Tax=Colwellia sp. Arc7-D TaxID=2161872 RepID=UPI000D3A3357|nr:hypothetical protein [Colwellia sp. Arc7-D]AWB57435.1 hypothetical protein DBO93_07660 [Colwellia sp. Arc7-D]
MENANNTDSTEERKSEKPKLELYDGGIKVKTIPITENIICETGKFENNICKKPDLSFYQEPSFAALVGIASLVIGGFLTYIVNIKTHDKTRPKGKIKDPVAYMEPGSRNYILVKLNNNGEQVLNVSDVSVLHKKSITVDREIKLIIKPIENIDEVKEFLSTNSGLTIGSKTNACFALYSQVPFSNTKLQVLLETGEKNVKFDVETPENFKPSLMQIQNVTKEQD